jgi:thioredoxin
MNTKPDAARIVEVDGKNFESEVLKSVLPVLVVFWSPWSGPCQILGPVLDEVVAACAGKWRVVRANADEHPALSLAYGVQYVPTLLYFTGGTLRAMTVGIVNKEAVFSQFQLISTGDAPRETI